MKLPIQLNANYVKGVKLEIEDSRFIPAENNMRTCIKIGAGNIDNTLNAIKTHLPGFKAGRGGNHIWISLPDNKRIAIIYFKR